jgi:hypothetical protein
MEVSVLPTHSVRLRARFIGLLAGLIAGVLNAVVARALMRVIALLTVGHGSFSVGGTAVIFMFGVLVGPLFGLIYRSTLYKLHAHELVKGLLFGLVLAVLQVLGLFMTPEFRAELMAVGLLGFAVYAAMNLAFVLTLAALTAWLEQAWPRDESRKAAEASLTTVFGLLALAGLALLVVEIVGRLLGIVE